MRTRTTKSRTALVGAALVAVLLGVSACGAQTGADGSADGDAVTASEDAAGTSDDAAATSGGGDLAAATPDLEGIPDVVAEVNGQPIAKDDFTGAYEAQFQQASMQAQMGGQPVDQDALKEQVLDGLIVNTLLVQEVEKHDLSVSDKEIDTMLTDLAEGNQMKTEDFLAALEEQGMSEEDVRTEVEKQIGTEKLLAEEAPVEDPTDEELQEYYDEIAAQQPAGSTDDAAATAEGSGLPPFEEIKPQLEEQLRSEKQSEATQAYVEKLRGEADITSHL